MEKMETLVALNGGGHYHAELYPREEREIRRRQESILAERNEPISRTEANLLQHFQGEELKMKKKELWRKEEENARKAAETSISNKKMLSVFLFVVLVGLLVGLVLSGPNKYLLAAAVVWMVIFMKMSPTFQEKIPRFSWK